MSSRLRTLFFLPLCLASNFAIAQNRNAFPPADILKHPVVISGQNPLPVPPAALVAPPPSLLYGVNVSWGDSGFDFARFDGDGGAKAKQIVGLMKDAGVTNTSAILKWSDIERTRGKYDWQAVDRFVSFIASKGFVITAVVTSAPNWATSIPDGANRQAGNRDNQPIPASRSVDLSRFASALGAHYKDKIHRWQFWQTAVTLGDAKGVDYARMLKVFYKGIKTGDPSATVSLGGAPAGDFRFLESVYSNGARTSFDAVALFPGGSATRGFEQVDRYFQILRSHGDGGKKIWLTDWDAQTTYPDQADGIVQRGEQAKLLKSYFNGLRRRPFIETSLFSTFNDFRLQKGEPLSLIGSGLLTYDLRPKPSFFAFQQEALQSHFTTPLPSPIPKRRLTLNGALSKSQESNVVHIDVELNQPAGGMQRGWFGSATDDLTPEQTASLSKMLANTSANWIRLEATRMKLGLPEDQVGSPAFFERADAALAAFAKSNASVILTFRNLPGATAESFSANVAQFVERYGKGTPYSVYRWEFAGTAEEAKNFYPVFTQTIRKGAPDRPIGFVLTEGDAVRGAKEFEAICTSTKSPVNSFSWTLQGTPKETAESVQQIRARFSTSTVLKDATLLPSMPDFKDSSDNETLAHFLRTADFAPLESSNPLSGVVFNLKNVLLPDGALTRTGEMMGLLDRLKGTRLTATTDDSGVRIIAAKRENKTVLLLWREPSRTLPDSETPTLIRLYGVSGGVHVERYDLGDNASRTASDLQGNEYQEEILLKLKPKGVTLLDLTLIKSSPIQITVRSVKKQAFGGETVDFDLTVKNVGAVARPVDMELSISGVGLPPTLPVRAALTPIPAGGERPVRFRIKTPVVPNDVTITFTLQSGGEARASSNVLLLSPISARLESPRVDILDPSQTTSVKIVLKNRTPNPIVLKLESILNAPKSDLSVTLKPNATTVYSMPIAPDSLDTGLTTVQIGVNIAGVRLKTLQALLGAPVNCRYAVRKPSFKGDITEWSQAGLISLIRKDQVHKKEWGGVSDLSAYVYTLWDEEALYVACDVTDDLFFAPFPENDMLKGDSVQFAVSALSGRPGGVGGVNEEGYGTGDHEFALALLGVPDAPTTKGSVPMQSIIKRLSGGKLSEAPGAKLSVKRDGAHTIYEASIPWSELAPTKPVVNGVFGFSLLVNDNDGLGAGYISYGGGINPAKRPILFPPLRLVKPL